MALTVAQIDQAIEDIIVKGQSSSVDGTSFTRANLPGLTELRDRLTNTEPRTNGKRPVFRSFNMSGAAND
jgi:hypothetical protein